MQQEHKAKSDRQALLELLDFLAIQDPQVRQAFLEVQEKLALRDSKDRQEQ